MSSGSQREPPVFYERQNRHQMSYDRQKTPKMPRSIQNQPLASCRQRRFQMSSESQVLKLVDVATKTYSEKQSLGGQRQDLIKSRTVENDSYPCSLCTLLLVFVVVCFIFIFGGTIYQIKSGN